MYNRENLVNIPTTTGPRPVPLPSLSSLALTSAPIPSKPPLFIPPVSSLPYAEASTSSGQPQPRDSEQIPGGCHDNEITRVVEQVSNSKTVGNALDGILAQLVHGGSDETADRCVTAFKSLLQLPKKRRNAMTKAFSIVLTGEALRKFTTRIVGENLFNRGRIFAISKLSYYRVPSFILMDYFALTPDSNILKPLVRLYSREEIEEVVNYVAEMYDRPDEVYAKLRGYDIFSGLSLQEIRDGMQPLRVRRFISLICRLAAIDIPLKARKVFVEFCLGPTVDSFLRHEAEAEDLYAMVKDLIANHAGLMGFTLDVISKKCSSLAAYIAARENLPPRPSEAEVVPVCRTPFNEELHNLAPRRELLFEGLNQISALRHHLQKSNYYAIDFHGVAKGLDEFSGLAIGLMTIRLRDICIFIMPKLSHDCFVEIADVLKESSVPVFSYRWKHYAKFFQELFGFLPTNVIDAATLAEERNMDATFDGLSRYITGGTYCSRGSNFGACAFPSTVAIRHRGIRATLIYEFVAECSGLRAERRDARASREAQETRPSREMRSRSRSRNRSHRLSSGGHRDRGRSSSDRDFNDTRRVEFTGHSHSRR